MNNRLYKKYGFDSNKNLRKLSYSLILEDYKSRPDCCAETTYKEFIIFVCWAKGDGISGYIFNKGKAIACVHYYYQEPEKIILDCKKYIDYIKPLLSSCE